MTNLTISLHENIVRVTRIRAIGEGPSISAKVREFLAQYAKAGAQAAPFKALNLPILLGGGGLLPGIDPSSNKSKPDATHGFLNGTA